MAQQLNVETVGFVYSYRTCIEAMLTGHPPNGPTMAAQIAARVRGWLKLTTWSEPARVHLTTTLDALESVVTDSAKVDREDAAAAAQTEQAEAKGTPGVYVYSLPHYLRHRFDPEKGDTLFKVGRSDVDVFQRVGSQARTTALPEDPVLLRIYHRDGGVWVDEEREFHGWLTAADHARSTARRGGREWFLTSLTFLDRIARSRGLTVDVVSDMGTTET